MNREDLIAHIWSDKREKIVGSVHGTHYPGLTIALNSAPITWHSLTYAVLEVLRGQPELALEWSRHWGRTRVVIHSRKERSVNFTLKGSGEERLATKIASCRRFGSQAPLVEEENQGQYLVLLNREETISFEGALLQVTRMVDELVWVNFLQHKGRGTLSPHETMDEVQLYAEVVEDIWNSGIVFRYVPEDVILGRVEHDSSLKVRIYGNVKKTHVLPTVIGGALVHPIGVPVPGFSALRDEAVSSFKHAARDNAIVLSSAHVSDSPYITAVGITLAKEIHLGHILTLVTAEVVRRTLCPDSKLYIESNDTGPRVQQMVAGLACSLNVTVKEAGALLVQEKVSPTLIYHHYRTRASTLAVQEVEAQVHESKPVLRAVEREALRQLAVAGFTDISLIADSECASEYQLQESQVGLGWPELGFSYARYVHNKAHGLVILKSQGVPTAAATRAAFARVALKDANARSLVYLDGDPSITKAKLLIQSEPGFSICQLEGCGIGFGGEMASGTGGRIPTIESLLSGTPNTGFLELGCYFLHTRYVTEEVNSGLLGFYDYRNEAALREDLDRAAHEQHVFKSNLVELIRRFEREANGELSDAILAKITQLVRYATSTEEIKPEQIFRKLRWKLEAPIRNYREWLNAGHDEDGCKEVDYALLAALAAEPSSWDELRERLSNLNGGSGKFRQSKTLPLSCSLVTILRHRGYEPEDIPHAGFPYLSGKLVLSRRVSAPWEFIYGLIETQEAFGYLNDNTRRLLRFHLEKCLSILGLVL